VAEALIPVSAGELVDKITILEIKSERMTDPQKLRNVRLELETLRRAWEESPLAKAKVSSQLRKLKTINAFSATGPRSRSASRPARLAAWS
jgi:hypothetical protein